MWDPTKGNSSNKISEDNRISEINKIDYDNQKVDTLSEQDSGIITSSNLTPINQQFGNKNKGKFNLTSSFELQDSGLVSDCEPSGEISTEIQEDKIISRHRSGSSSYRIQPDESEKMLVDSGVVVDTVSEQLLSLSLNISINNLDKPKIPMINAPLVSIGEFTNNQDYPNLTFKKYVTENWEKHYQQDEDGETHLHLAIIHEYQEVQMALLRLAPAPCLLDIQNSLFQSPLHLAVLTKQPYTVRKLLLAGADANIKDRHGNSPLHLACFNGNIDCVRELTKPITAEEILEATILQNQYMEYVKKCIYRPNLEQRNYDGENCVHIAAIKDDLDILQHLVYCGADINAREGKAGRTPLHIAIEEGKPNVVNFLLKECPTLRVETSTFSGLTAYQFAAEYENNDALKDLVKLGAEPLSPPDSEADDDCDDEFDENMLDRYSSSNSFYKTFNGTPAINVT